MSRLIWLLAMSSALGLPRLLSANTSLVSAFQSCAGTFAKSTEELSTLKATRTAEVNCVSAANPVLTDQQNKNLRDLTRITAGSDWQKKLAKTALVYERFLSERELALKNTNSKIEKLTTLDSVTLAAEVKEDLKQYNQLCKNLKSFRVLTKGGDETREKHEAISAKAFDALLARNQTLKILLTAKPMQARSAALFDGTLGFRHCADGISVFAPAYGDGKDLLPPHVVRSALREVKENLQNEKQAIAENRQMIRKSKNLIDEAKSENNAENTRSGAIRQMNSMQMNLGKQMNIYPEAVARILADPKTTDPAVASIFCSSLSENSEMNSRLDTLQMVGFFAVGIATAPVSGGAAVIELGLGLVYSGIRMASTKGERSTQLATANLLGLLADDNMDAILTDEIAAANSELLSSASFFLGGKLAGKTLPKVARKSEVLLVKYLAKGKLGEAEIAKLIQQLQSVDRTSDKTKLVKEVLGAAEAGNAKKLEESLKIFAADIRQNTSSVIKTASKSGAIPRKEATPISSMDDWLNSKKQKFYHPMPASRSVDVADLLKSDESYRKTLDQMGIKYRVTNKTTYIETELTAQNAAGQDPFYGKIYNIVQLPPASKNGNFDSNAFEHPQMAEYHSKLKAMGYKLVVDSSLPFSNANNYFWQETKVVALRPNSTWSSFIHEFQHAEFESLISLNFSEIQSLAKKGGEEIAPMLAKTFDYDPVRAKKLVQLIRMGLPEIAVDESLSVTEQLALMGWKRFIPQKNSHSEKYMLRHQVHALLDLQKTETLTAVQAQTLRNAQLRYAGILAYDIGAPIIALGAGTYGLTKAGSAALDSIEQLDDSQNPLINTDQDKTKLEDFRQVLRNDKGDLIGQLRNGKWIHVKTHVPKTKKEPMKR